MITKLSVRSIRLELPLCFIIFGNNNPIFHYFIGMGVNFYYIIGI